jgi:hypothetical protein
MDGPGINTSRLGKLVAAAMANPMPVAAPAVPSQPAFSLASMVEQSFSEAAPPQPIPAAPHPGPKPLSLVEQLAAELSATPDAVMQALRGLDQSRPSPTSAEEPRSAPPPPVQPVHENRHDRFYQRGEVFGSGYGDEGDLIPVRPGESLSSALINRSSRKDW